MNGERLYPNKFGGLCLPERGYGCDVKQRWWMRPAGGNALRLDARDVVEHPDSTITVSGFINRGTWRF